MKNIFKFAYQFMKSLFTDSFEFAKIIISGVEKAVEIIFLKSASQLKEDIDSMKPAKVFLDPSSDEFYKNFQKNIDILQGKKKEDS